MIPTSTDDWTAGDGLVRVTREVRARGADDEVGPVYTCHDCPLGVVAEHGSARAMLLHLKEHDIAGHAIPDRAVEILAEHNAAEEAEERRRRARSILADAGIDPVALAQAAAESGPDPAA